MTHGTIAGIVLSDLILKKQNKKWADLYSPSRRIDKTIISQGKSINKGPNKDNENENNRPEDNHAKTQNKSIMNSLLPRQGVIVEETSGNPVATYKDIDDQIHVFSAKCTHLGRTLTWNPFEESFDCPCHDSRFFNNRKVINGPANNELEKKK